MLSVMDRIKEYCVLRRLSQKVVADDLDMPYRTIQSYFMGKREPSLEFITRFSGCYDVSSSWLLHGREEFTVESIGNQKSKLNNISTYKPSNNDIIRIKFTNVEASMGGGSHTDSEVDNFVEIAKSTLESEFSGKINYQKLFAMRVVGDSMQPDIRSNSIVISEFITDNTKIVNGAIYIIRHCGLIMCKKIQKISESSFKIISSNPIYPTIDLDTGSECEDFKIIGRSIMILQKVDYL